MRILFLSYHPQPSFTQAADWLRKIQKFSDLMECLAARHSVYYIKQTGFEENSTVNGVHYEFLKAPRRKSYFPGELHNRIKRINPDLVLISGIRFPLQIMQLRQKLGKKVVIIGRHHAEKPPRGLRSLLQKQACRAMNAFLFTADALAQEWIAAGLISERQPIGLMPAASTRFQPKDKTMARAASHITGHPVLLWVGRDDPNKDPDTVVKAFGKFAEKYPEAALLLVFSCHPSEEAAVRSRWLRTVNSQRLQPVNINIEVNLRPEDLENRYSAADIFINSSHREGGSFALLEAMACGCIPLVSAISANLALTAHGEAGLFFEPGNAEELCIKMEEALQYPDEFHDQVIQYFRAHFSNEKMAEQLEKLAILSGAEKPE